MSQISELVKYSNRTYEKGFVSATDGNLSVRLDNNRIAITKSGINKGDVREEDIILVDLKGNKISGVGSPSSELKIHLLAYINRPDINSVVHCHPIYATAFATSQNDLMNPVFPEVILTIGKIPLCKYATPSTDELPDSMLPFIKDSFAMLLQNHGAVTFGDNIKTAYFRMEKLEHAAKTLFAARLLGGEIKLSETEVEKLLSISNHSYGNNPTTKVNANENLLNQNKTFTEIIEERLRARAGNPIHKINN